MKRVVTFGTFDLFHIGHLNILERASKMGGHLIVGVSSDELNFSKKQFHPVFSYADRARLVGALACVDEVFKEESLEAKGEYLIEHNADILVMGADWEGKFDCFRKLCEVMYLPRSPDISTTALKERLRFPV